MNSATYDETGAYVESQLVPQVITENDLQCLRRAYFVLEHPSFAARLSNAIGTPVEVALDVLPVNWSRKVHQQVQRVLMGSLRAAVSSLRPEPEEPGNSRASFYQSMIAGSGAMGGLLGLPGLAIELPVTTTLMLRSIAEIARAEGENIHDADTQAACMQVFALGGLSATDDAADTGYYGVRLAMASYMTSAVEYIAQHGLSGQAAPALVKFIQLIARSFGVALSQRAAAQVVPVVGAAGAATVNVIFLKHFQRMAQAHFTVRRLERKYGSSFIRSQFELFDVEA